MFTQDCNFIFVPVDKDFNSLIDNLETSDTSFPSELDLNGVAGFLLVPAFLDTKEILFSPWMKSHEFPDIKGYFLVTARPENDGIIMMNWDPTKKQEVPKGVNVIGTVEFKKTATVPGFQQNYVIYMKTGTAYIFEKLLRNHDWESEYVSQVLSTSVRKIANAYPANKTISIKLWEGLSIMSQFLKEVFAASSSTIGFEISGDTKTVLEKEVFDILSDTFYDEPTYFSTLSFDPGIIEMAKNKAQKEGQIEFFDHLSKL